MLARSLDGERTLIIRWYDRGLVGNAYQTDFVCDGVFDASSYVAAPTRAMDRLMADQRLLRFLDVDPKTVELFDKHGFDI